MNLDGFLLYKGNANIVNDKSWNFLHLNVKRINFRHNSSNFWTIHFFLFFYLTSWQRQHLFY